MIKINKKYLSIPIFLLILIIFLTGCSKNPVTNNYGPSWDMMLQLPVTEQEDTLNDLVEAEQFDNMGISTDETSIISFYVIGTQEKPITKNLDLDLPELEANLASGIDVSENIGFDNGTGDLPSVTLQFPDMTFGSSGNVLTFSLSNIVGNQIDNITIELWDKNAGRTTPLDTISFNNVTNDASKNLYLNNKVIEEENLEMKFSYEQSSGPVTADMSITGLQNITIKKVENLEVSTLDTPTFNDLTVELGVFESIKGYDGNNAELKISITEPSSMNIDFAFDTISIAGVAGTKENDYFIWSGSEIQLGTVSLDGTLEVPSDNIINYDSTDTANIDVSIKGKAEKTEIPPEYQDEFNIENGDLIYTSDPMEVDISQDDIDTMQEGVINLDETYLETIIENNTGLQLAAEVYIGNDKSNLYITDNKVNERLLEVTLNENEPKRFLLKNAINKVEETLTEGNVYMGIKFIAGDLDVDTGTDINFTDNMSLNIKSSVYVKVRINQ